MSCFALLVLCGVCRCWLLYKMWRAVASVKSRSCCCVHGLPAAILLSERPLASAAFHTHTAVLSDFNIVMLAGMARTTS